MAISPILRGGSLDGTTAAGLPDQLANQDFYWYFNTTATSPETLEVYSRTGATDSGAPVFAILEDDDGGSGEYTTASLALDSDVMGFPAGDPTLYAADSADAVELITELQQKRPDPADPELGIVSKFNENHACVNKGLVADITISATTLTFQLTTIPKIPNTFCVHYVGAKRNSTATNCIFMVVGKTSNVSTDANGISQRFHNYQANGYIVSQWFVPGVGFSNPVEVRTW